MTGKIFFLAALAAVCDAGLISLSSDWPSPTACSGTSSGGLNYLPNPGSQDYNQLLHVLYPELTEEPLDDVTLGLVSAYSQLGTNYEMKDLYRAVSPGLKGSNRLIVPSREFVYSPFRGIGRSISYDDFRNGCGEYRYDDCRNSGEMRGKCECGECVEGIRNCECRGCDEEMGCMNGCRGCSKSRNCSHQRSNCEYRACDNRRHMGHRSCCATGECFPGCGCMGCSKPMTSRSVSNYKKYGASGCSSQRNGKYSPFGCMKIQGQCCSTSMCC